MYQPQECHGRFIEGNLTQRKVEQKRPQSRKVQEEAGKVKVLRDMLKKPSYPSYCNQARFPEFHNPGSPTEDNVQIEDLGETIKLTRAALS